ncbi:MAG: CBS domain-containing protein [Alphaproteobacteria bacterium]|nr:CBS domain-containing protein [Alphaproteobacteria bacterium]MDE2493562.1 CBS domain-containing protein [Alphaproteobacteria bacterium]
MKIIDVLNKKGRKYHKIPPNEKFPRILELLVSHGVGSLVVTDVKGVAIGIVTERSVVEALVRWETAVFEEVAESIMFAPAPSCRPELDVRAAMHTMTSLRTRHLVVRDDMDTYGIVSLGDLVKFRLQESELENVVLRDMAGARRFLAERDDTIHPRNRDRW